MGMPIKVTTNADEVSRFLLKVHKDQVPFATAKALTSTAFDVRKELVDRTYPESFKLKNRRFPSVATNVKKANKRDLTATVGNISGRAIDYLVLHAEGGTKRPQGRHLAVPTANTKRGAQGAVPKAQRPRRLLLKKKSFVTTVNNNRVVAVRKGKERYPIEIKYVFIPEAKIDKALLFFEAAQKVVDRVYKKHFAEAFALAIKTAR